MSEPTPPSDRRPIELFGVLSLGYLFFIVAYANLGFAFRESLSPYSLLVSFVVYVVICLLLLWLIPLARDRKAYAIALGGFIGCAGLLFLASTFFFSRTYDTSWDGQGYQSSGVISLAQGWNPLYQANLPVSLPDATVLVKGYPKALWEVQANVYLATGKLDAAKVTNLAAALLAAAFSFAFLRRLRLSLPLSGLVAVLVATQSVPVIQFLSFMADGFSYQMLVVAIASIGLVALSENATIGLISFAAAEFLLVGTKYSNLPAAAVLAVPLLCVLLRKLVFRELSIAKGTARWLAACGILFLLVPYLSNAIHYRYVFYPTNLAQVSEAPKVDNTPKNLLTANPVKLVFYSIYSKSQVAAVGTDSPKNIATLKIPFTFSIQELKDSVFIFDNRVGAAGPLFSGAFTLSILLAALMAANRSMDRKRKLSLLAKAGTAIALILLLTFVSPVPNLLRYNTQILLIPMVVLVTALAWFRQSRLITATAWLLLACLAANASLYTWYSARSRLQETHAINAQLASMRGSAYAVKANNFFSTYVRLQQHGVSFETASHLTCAQQQVLVDTSYTTRYCPE